MGAIYQLMLVHLFVFCLLTQNSESTNYSEPVTPGTYATEMGVGFSTNWFKIYPPLKKYNLQNIIDVENAGFKNLRLRSRADLYSAPYDAANFTTFLTSLSQVVDDCIDNNVFPVITWIHHHAEAYASDEDQENYVTWWKKVAEALKDKDYRLSFNLFTELGVDVCQKTGNCAGSLKMNSTKYNAWTSRVVSEIRASGGKNNKRILILASPQKTSKGLKYIEKGIYENDGYMMAEFHTYASGPNQKPGSPKYWEGNGTAEQRQTLIDEINTAQADIPLYCYFGAWMPQDNSEGALNQTEVENFARYFVSVMKNASMPTALNVLDVYYNTKQAAWITDYQNIKGQMLNMSRVFEVIQDTIA